MPRRSPPLLALFALGAAGAACGDDPVLDTPDKEVCLMRSDGQRYCIEMYEASKKDATRSSAGQDIVSPPRALPGRMPWTEVTWAAARAACEAKNKRLCERDEWVDACDGTPGAGGAKYAYGDALDAASCNTAGAGAEPGGAHAGCRGPSGTYDQSGNVWEWTGSSAAIAAARGGGYRSDIVHECKSGDSVQLFRPDAPSPEVGFRCCRAQ